MSKKVILVGHCGPDSSYLRMAVSSASKGVTISLAHSDASLDKLIDDGADLVLLNRELEYGFSTYVGVEMIQRLREKYPNLKMMLVSNYPEVQEAAVAAVRWRASAKARSARAELPIFSARH